MVVDGDVFGGILLESYRLPQQVALHVLSPTLSYQCGCLSLCSRRVVSRPRQMRPHVDPASAPRSTGTSPAPLSTRALFLSFTRLCLSDSMYAFILALPVKVLSIIGLIRSRHSLLCGLIALPCHASAGQPGQPQV